MADDGWIPVRARLPADYGQYLVFGHWTGRDGFEVYRVAEAGWDNDEGWIAFYGEQIFPITHWQPLPAPPTSKETK